MMSILVFILWISVFHLLFEFEFKVEFEMRYGIKGDQALFSKMISLISEVTVAHEYRGVTLFDQDIF